MCCSWARVGPRAGCCGRCWPSARRSSWSPTGRRKAVRLAAAAAGQGPVEGCGFEALPGRRFDLIINGTAAGLQGDVPAIPDGCLADGGWVYDMMYGSEPTAFVRWGQAHGAARALDGLGMLVEQAAESFFLWRGVQPDTAPVIDALRAGSVP